MISAKSPGLTGCAVENRFCLYPGYAITIG